MTSVLITLAVITLPTPSVVDAKLPASLDLTTIRAITAQHDGRWPPLDTVARQTVNSVTGDIFYEGHDPVLLLFAWTFDASTWADQPLFRIKNAELRSELHLPASLTAFSYTDLINHEHIRSLIEGLAHIPQGRKMNPLESKVADISDRLALLQRVFRGSVIRLIPDPDDISGAWRPISPMADSQGDIEPARKAWVALASAFLADDPVAFTTASQDLATALAALPAAHRPAPQLIAVELRYNRLRLYRVAWQIMAVSAFLAAAALYVRRKWFDALVLIGIVAGFAVLTCGLKWRWEIAGRIPAANMFESLLFLSWGMGAFAILSVFLLRHRLVLLTASFMGAVSLALADCLPMNQFVRPIVPVLMDTVWMSIHVPVIMVSYSVLALGVLVAHVQLFVMAGAPSARKLAGTLDSMHYWYIHIGTILLTAGIITGSMWAASSWGRYWGWDPKEVWSLVALLGYLTILHVRLDHHKTRPWMYVVALVLGVALFAVVAPLLAPLTAGKIIGLVGTAAGMVLLVVARGRFATAVKSVLCFWLIIMTYVGVNYVLGIGLHSYGFGTGAIAHYLFLTGGIDLALIALCCAVYLLRRGSAPTSLEPTPVVSMTR